MKKMNWMMLLLIVMLGFCLVACSNDDDDLRKPTEPDSINVTPTNIIEPTNVAPLTSTPLPTDTPTPMVSPTPIGNEKDNYKVKIERRFIGSKYSGRDEYIYNSFGKEIRREEYDANEVLTRWSECEYDSMERLVSETSYKNGFRSWWHKYEYDSENRVIKSISGEEDKLVDTTSYVYDQLRTDLVKKEIETLPSGITNCTEHTYDSSGNVVTTTFDSDDESGFYYDYFTLEMEYDEFGMCTKQIKQLPDGKWFGYEKSYERDKNGNITRVIEVPLPRNTNYEEVNFEEYSYDSRGNKTEYKKYLASYGLVEYFESLGFGSAAEQSDLKYDYNGKTYDAMFDEWQKYEYDSFGRIVNWETLSKEGIVERRVEYEYINEWAPNPTQKPTIEFSKNGDFDFPVEDQLFFEELEKTHIEPFLDGWKLYKRMISFTGKTHNGFQEYKVSYIYNKGVSALTIVLCPMTRMSCDVSKIADNLLYEYLEENADGIGTVVEAEMVVGLLGLWDYK